MKWSVNWWKGERNKERGVFLCALCFSFASHDFVLSLQIIEAKGTQRTKQRITGNRIVSDVVSFVLLGLIYNGKIMKREIRPSKQREHNSNKEGKEVKKNKAQTTKKRAFHLPSLSLFFVLFTLFHHSLITPLFSFLLSCGSF